MLALLISALTLIPATPAIADHSNKPLANKHILWVDSYHRGYPWSEGTELGLRKVLAGTRVKIDVFRMDAKRKSDATSLQANGLAALRRIEKTQPDLIVASDDPAQVYLVLPHLLGKSIPIVFTGVNLTAEPYGYPRAGITGMIETFQTQTLINHLGTLAKGERFAVLASDDISEKKVFDYFRSQKNLFREDTPFVAARSYEEFQQKFLELQKTRDAIVLLNVTTLPGWEKNESRKWIHESTKVPTGTVNDWMSDLVLVTVAKIAEEQGEFAGHTALRILQGERPESIPITSNQQSQLFLNSKLAEKLGIRFPLSMLRATASPAKQ